jgi:V/A-type H+-transporting ATPase subunit C
MSFPFLHYPSFGQENTNYAYAVGRVRALETALLDTMHLERMLDTENPEDLLRVLQDTVYGTYIPDLPDPSDYERMLSRETARAFDLFVELCLDTDLEEILRARYDYHNVKVLLKGLIAEKDFGHALLPLGNHDPERLMDIFAEESYGSLPPHLEDTVREGIEAYYDKKDPKHLDMAVDRALYRHLTGNAVRNVFLRSYYRLESDMIDLRTLVRLTVLEREDLVRFALLSTGYLNIQDYVGESLEALPERLFVTPYHGVLRDGLSYLKTSDSFARLERLSDEYLHGFLMKAGTVDLGPEPLVAFLLKKLNEIRLLRVVFVGILNGVPKEMMRERIPSV